MTKTYPTSNARRVPCTASGPFAAAALLRKPLRYVAPFPFLALFCCGVAAAQAPGAAPALPTATSSPQCYTVTPPPKHPIRCQLAI